MFFMFPETDTASTIYYGLKEGFGLTGATGQISFYLKDYHINVEQNSAVGTIFEEWLAKWCKTNSIPVKHNPKQTAPDFWLNPDDSNFEWLEIKTFTGSPNFDLGGFKGFLKEIISKPYKVHAKYLIVKYKMKDGIITIEDLWLKKLWELSCTSKKYAIKVQPKHEQIINIRPSTFYSESVEYPSFTCLEHFISALHKTMYQSKDKDTNTLAEEWLDKFIKAYYNHYNVVLDIPRWYDIQHLYNKQD